MRCTSQRFKACDRVVAAAAAAAARAFRPRRSECVETTRREAVVPAVRAQVSKRVLHVSSRYVSSGLPARIVKLGSRWGSVKMAGVGLFLVSGAAAPVGPAPALAVAAEQSGQPPDGIP